MHFRGKYKFLYIYLTLLCKAANEFYKLLNAKYFLPPSREGVWVEQV